MSDSSRAEAAEIRRETTGIPDDPPRDDHARGDEPPESSEPLAEIPRFPVDKLCGPLRAFADWAVRDGLHAECAVAAALAALVTLTGPATLKLGSKTIRAILWVVLVGIASAGKSPAYEHAFSLIREKYAEQRKKYEADLADWHEILETEGKKAAGFPPARPEPYELDDATTEAVARWLTARGADTSGSIVDDELAAFLEGLNQYKGGQGSDLSKWLKMWTGAPLHIQRVGAGGSRNQVSLYVGEPVVSVTGPLVPANLHLLGKPGSGFRPRWLPFYAPAAAPGWNHAGDYPEEWKGCITGLMANREQREWSLTGKARSLWEIARQRWHDQQYKPEPDDVIEALRKADAQALRIALVVAESMNPAGTGGEIPAKAVSCAVAIVDYCINVWRALPGNSTMTYSRREDVMDTAHRRLVAWLETRPARAEGLPEGTAPRPGASRREVQQWLHEPAKKLNELVLEHRDRWPDCVVPVTPEHGGRQTVMLYAPPRGCVQAPPAMLPQHRPGSPIHPVPDQETQGQGSMTLPRSDVADDVADTRATSHRNIAPELTPTTQSDDTGACAVCRKPLDPALGALGETTHPLCDPAETGRAA